MGRDGKTLGELTDRRAPDAKNWVRWRTITAPLFRLRNAPIGNLCSPRSLLSSGASAVPHHVC